MVTTQRKLVIANEQPTWICHKCGIKYGRVTYENHPSTWHSDTCDVCGKIAAVTEPRDYGYLVSGWQQERF